PPGSVAIWERYLAYATAFGAARETCRCFPFTEDDPSTAWSRVGGEWHQVRIEYPTRWGFGQKPANVFLVGVVLTLFWGAIGFVLLPIAGNIVYDFGTTVIDDQNLGDRALLGLVLGIVGGIAVLGIYVLFRLLDGVMRLGRGALDLGRWEIVDGQVVNVHLGRVAVDAGRDDEIRAWLPT